MKSNVKAHLPPRGPGPAPTVSVIVGVKNGAAVLQGCLDSVAAQDWDSRETIVVDSASTDGTPAMLEANRRAGKITDYVSEPDRGLYEAWNKALRRARGEWICFLGCDDRFHDAQALRSLLGAAAGGARVIHGRVNLVTANGVVGEVLGKPWREARRAFLAGTMLPHTGMLHHRSLFEEHGFFDESYRIAGDYDLLLREVLTREPVFVDRVTVDMRFGGMSSKPGAILGNLREIQRARMKRGLRGMPARLRLAIAAAWIGDVIRAVLGDRVYGWCADFYRVARGKPRIWTA
ncbi:MAG: glycosyltransferase [Betaproteobacteria bacterium]|nr:glycosyltransferase [Betaproteobacteria bacterium]MDH5222770.1 glycosyltransferase [Betaproteobacteria bacterium]MDH5350159.1 glycosyltransferase [Betaproteobacteria bacterium]